MDPNTPALAAVATRPAGKVQPLVFVPLGRDVVRDSWVLNGLMDIWGQGWAHIKTEANATDIQRNQAAEVLLKAPPEFTHLVMLDADHRHPPDTVRALIRAAEERPHAGYIVAINYRRRQPFDPCVWIERDGEVYQPVKWDKGWVGPLFRTGLAACIIPRTTFERIERPWFANTYNVTPTEMVYKREDFYFADKVRKAGLEIWADGRIEASPHEPNLPRWVDGQWWQEYVRKHPQLVAASLPEETGG